VGETWFFFAGIRKPHWYDYYREGPRPAGIIGFLGAALVASLEAPPLSFARNFLTFVNTTAIAYYQNHEAPADNMQ